jgi:hypothetical protein
VDFRQDLQPTIGAPYDERLYQFVNRVTPGSPVVRPRARRSVALAVAPVCVAGRGPKGVQSSWLLQAAQQRGTRPYRIKSGTPTTYV